MARGQSSCGQGCIECLGLSWPNTTPQPGAAGGGAGRLSQRPQKCSAWAGATPLEGPSACGPRPAARGRCRTVPTRRDAVHTHEQQQRTWGSKGCGRWAGKTNVPIVLRDAVSGQGRPKGPGRLVEGDAGCKDVPRGLRGGGLCLGGDRAVQGVRREPGLAGAPHWRGEDSSAPAPPPHIWREATGRGPFRSAALIPQRLRAEECSLQHGPAGGSGQTETDMPSVRTVRQPLA